MEVSHGGSRGGAARGALALELGHIEHLRREIDAGDLGGAGVGKGLGQVAGAARHVQHVAVAVNARGPNGRPAPALVLEERMQPVVQVVAACDGREHGLHLAGLLGVRVRVPLQRILCPDGSGLGHLDDRRRFLGRGRFPELLDNVRQVFHNGCFSLTVAVTAA